MKIIGINFILYVINFWQFNSYYTNLRLKLFYQNKLFFIVFKFNSWTAYILSDEQCPSTPYPQDSPYYFCSIAQVELKLNFFLQRNKTMGSIYHSEINYLYIVILEIETGKSNTLIS